jgi:hypothetical protein
MRATPAFFDAGRLLAGATNLCAGLSINTRVNSYYVMQLLFGL